MFIECHSEHGPNAGIGAAAEGTAHYLLSLWVKGALCVPQDVLIQGVIAVCHHFR